MLRNYILVAIRNLSVDKLSTLINLLGLSVGISACLILALFAKNELSYDEFHSKKERLYRAWVREEIGQGKVNFMTSTPFPLGPALVDNFPEVEASSVFVNQDWKVEIDKQLQEALVTIVGVDFFNMFTFEPVEGSLTSPFMTLTDMVITESVARKHFGNEPAVGRSLIFAFGDEAPTPFFIRAVVKDAPPNSSFSFGYLVSDRGLRKYFGERAADNWFVIFGESYILLKENADVTSLVEKFPELVNNVIDPMLSYEIGLQPLTDIHTNLDFPVGRAPVTDPRYAYILAGMAGFILMMACINFITLSIGRSVMRSREVGLRKIVGATRQQLIIQFLSETTILVLMGLLVGLILAKIFMPVFNDIAGKRLNITFSFFLTGICATMVVVIGIVAGTYPALIISGFKPVLSLKGSFQGVNTKGKLRRLLLGVQFVISLTMIAGFFIMSDQLSFLQSKNLGFDKEQLAVIPLKVRGGRINATFEKGLERAELFSTALSRNTFIKSVAATSQEIGNSWMRIGFTTNEGAYRETNLNVISPEYIQTMGMNIVQGRNFQRDNQSDFRRSVIVNETFVKEFGLSNPVGNKIPGPGFGDNEIIGVVRDFHFQSLHGKINPVMMVLDFDVASGFEDIKLSSSPAIKLVVRYDAAHTDEVIASINAASKDITGNSNIDYYFLTQKLEDLYKSDHNLRNILTAATTVSVMLASMGLFAFTSLSIKNKLKELSIRKVLGASETNIIVLIAGEYLLLIAVSFLMAVPVTWYASERWLDTFAYRVHVSPFNFILAIIMLIVIAFFTIGFRLVQAARIQPADSLRVE